jgi:hypothetical protein
MGQVKDIYWHQMQAGDEFVGWSVSLLSMMNGDFVASPAFFDETMDEEWIKYTGCRQSVSFFLSRSTACNIFFGCVSQVSFFTETK